MDGMKKYLDVDLVAELSKLVDAHVKHYKGDFDHDRKSLARAAKAELPEDKTLIWFCRESGTHCLRESQAFIRISRCASMRSNPARTSLPGLLSLN